MTPRRSPRTAWPPSRRPCRRPSWSSPSTASSSPGSTPRAGRARSTLASRCCARWTTWLPSRQPSCWDTTPPTLWPASSACSSEWTGWQTCRRCLAPWPSCAGPSWTSRVAPSADASKAAIRSSRPTVTRPSPTTSWSAWSTRTWPTRSSEPRVTRAASSAGTTDWWASCGSHWLTASPRPATPWAWRPGSRSWGGMMSWPPPTRSSACGAAGRTMLDAAEAAAVVEVVGEGLDWLDRWRADGFAALPAAGPEAT